MYGCESWTIKKAEHWRIDASELWCWRRFWRVPWTERRSIESVLKEISPECIGRTDAEAEAPILGPPDAKNWLIEKEPNAGKDWRQEEMGRTEDEMVGWYHLLSGHEFDQVLGVCDGPGGLVCCSPWGHKESETTEQLNWTGAGVLSNHLALEPWVSTPPCLTVSKQGSLSHEAPDVRPRMNLSASLSASIPWTLAQGCGAQSLQRKEIIHRKHNSPVSWRLFPF